MIQRFKVNLDLKRKTIPDIHGFGRSVVTKMTGSAIFPNPTPSLVVLSAALDELSASMSQAHMGGEEQTARMYVACRTVENLLTWLGSYVEVVSNQLASDDAGADVYILMAGMTPKRFRKRNKQVFGVKHGELPGTVVLRAAGIRHGLHFWEYTQSREDETSWKSITPTSRATVLVSGLKEGKRYYFRHRVVDSNGATDWESGPTIVAG